MSTPGPLTLAIEASNPGPLPEREEEGTPRVSVCIGRAWPDRPAEVIGFEGIGVAGRDDERLIPAVDQLVRATGLAPGDLQRIAVSVGPGGFTGLRVAVTFAKMVCEATGAACIAVPTARALIRRVDLSLRNARETLILLAWKRDDVWAERYAAGSGASPTVSGVLTPIRGLGPLSDRVVVCDAALETTMRTSGVLPDGAAVVRPRFDAAAVLEASAVIDPIDPLTLVPLYPREPEAATKRRELRKRSP